MLSLEGFFFSYRMCLLFDECVPLIWPREANTCLGTCAKYALRSSCACAVIWAFGHHLFSLSVQWFCKRTLKALISLCGRAGWSRPSISANARRHVFLLFFFVFFYRMARQTPQFLLSCLHFQLVTVKLTAEIIVKKVVLLEFLKDVIRSITCVTVDR